MKKSVYLLLFLFTSVFVNSQTINRISAYYNAYDESSGIIGIANNGIYEYGWYYDQWLAIPLNGLAFNGEFPIINEVSAFDNNSLNPSGIYVISDTAVHVYNYYSEYWYPLYNEGLERFEGKVLLSDLSAHYDVEDDEIYVYVKSGDHVYYYGWYFQQWFPLSNDGLASKQINTADKISSSIFPNPIIYSSKISFTLPENHSGQIKIAVFTEDGKIIKEYFLNDLDAGIHELDISPEEFTPGIYYYEIAGVNFSHVKKFIKVE